MSIDVRLLEILETRRRADQQSSVTTANGGGGGEPPDGPGLGDRVTVLERTVGSIERTLAIISEQMRHLATKDDVRAIQVELATRAGKLDTDIATLSGKLERKADAIDLAEIKGRVARIPTVPVLTSILLFVSLLFAAAAWALRHLPPSWAHAIQ